MPLEKVYYSHESDEGDGATGTVSHVASTKRGPMTAQYVTHCLPGPNPFEYLVQVQRLLSRGSAVNRRLGLPIHMNPVATRFVTGHKAPCIPHELNTGEHVD